MSFMWQFQLGAMINRIGNGLELELCIVLDLYLVLFVRKDRIEYASIGRYLI